MVEGGMAMIVAPRPRTHTAARQTPLHQGVLITLSAVVVGSLGFAATYLVNRSILPSALVLTSSIGLGLVSGFAARASLRNRSRWLRWLAATAGLYIGLMFLGWLTTGIMGVDLLGRPLSGPDWGGLMHAALGVGATWLAVHAWSSKSPSPSSIEAGQEPSDASRGLGGQPVGLITDHASAQQVAADRMPLLSGSETPVEAENAPITRSAARARMWRFGLGLAPRARRQTSRTPALGPAASSSPRRRLGPAIRFTGVAEIRCPFCLDHIIAHDPRGVRTCAICHTAHHADCWDETGTCQVPHFQA